MNHRSPDSARTSSDSIGSPGAGSSPPPPNSAVSGEPPSDRRSATAFGVEQAIAAFWRPYRPGDADTGTRSEPLHAGEPLLKCTIGDALDRAMRGLADAEAVLHALGDHTGTGLGWHRLHIARLLVHVSAGAIATARDTLPLNAPADPIPF